MFIHHVFFWLKPDLDKKQIQRFEEALISLKAIPTVKASQIGVPAKTSGAGIDATYSYSLLLRFEDGDDEALYQNHPIHLDFVSACGSLWEKAVVYDSVDLI